MANMSYCRFENTYRDLLDCLSAMNDRLDDREKGYRDRLVDVCKEIIEEHELNKMSDDVWGDHDWGFYITVDEYEEGTNEDNNNNSANDEAQDHNVFGENKI
jgi:hypothetical protein